MQTPTSLRLSIAAAAAAGVILFLLLGPRAGSLMPMASLATRDRGVRETGDTGQVAESRMALPATRSAAGFYRAPLGSRFSHGLRVQSTVTRRYRSKSAVRRDSELLQDTVQFAGRLEVLVVARRAEECVLHVRCLDLRFTGSSPRQAWQLLRADLGVGVFVRMANDGTTIGYRFAAGFHPLNRNWARTLVSAMRIIVPDDADREWRTSEADGTGWFTADYRWTDDRASLRKTKSALRLSSDGADADLQSLTTAVLDQAQGWIRRVDFAETLSMTVPTAGLHIQVENVVKVACTGVVVVPATRLPRVDWSGTWAPPSGGDDTVFASAPTPNCGQEIAGTNLGRCLADIERLLASVEPSEDDLADLERKIELMVKLRRGAVTEVERALGRPELRPRAASILLRALARAGTPEAQGLIGRVVLDGGRSGERRLQAVLAAHAVASPSDQLVGAVRRVAKDSKAPERVSRSGLLVLGALSATKRTPVAGSRAMLESLLSMERDVMRMGRVDTWMSALGNAGTEQALPIVKRYLGHRDSRLRERAVDVLRKLSASSGATDLLIAVASRDRNAEVRVAAARLLADHGAPGVRRLATMLRREESTRVRGAALAALGRRVADPAARAAITRVERSDRSPKLRAIARRMLGI